MLLVTHEMKFAQEVAHRIIYLHDGIIEEQGAPQAIFGAPQSEHLKRFISALS
jgi:octopine/nopaline transport system ATP-binding protein